MISNLLSFLGNFFGFMSKRQDAKNAPDVKANKVAGDRAEVEERITDEIRRQDVNAIRKELAE